MGELWKYVLVANYVDEVAVMGENVFRHKCVCVCVCVCVHVRV